MIYRKMKVLAGSILVATGSHAAIDLSSGEIGELLIVFNTTGQGSYYQFIPGVAAESLLPYNAPLDDSGFPREPEREPGFSIDISTAASYLGGTVESIALLALYETGNPVTFNYNEFLYVDVGGGLIYSSSAPSITSNVQLNNAIFNLQSVLDYANLGHNIEGSLGDFDSRAITSFYLNSLSSANDLTASFFSSSFGTNTFQFTSERMIVFTPVPAAAWLFLSAVGGLFGIKKSELSNSCRA